MSGSSDPRVILYLHESTGMGGGENSLLLLISCLDRSRCSPVCILPDQGPLCAHLRSIGVEVLVHPFPVIRRLLGVAAVARFVRRVIREKRVSLVHSNSIRTHIYGVLARGFSRKPPLVWHQRNLLLNEKFDPDRMLSFLCDAVVCNSRAIARRFMTRGGLLPDKVKVVLNGVDTVRFNPAVDGRELRGEFGIGEAEIVVGIASRFNAVKGHEVFFEAARMLMSCPEGVKMRFLVVGAAVFAEDARREQELRQKVEAAGLAAKVVFTGFRGDMPQVYAAMDIFVLPSSSEACGRVVLEAMASGRPLVATSTGGTPELVDDGVTGLLMAPSDAGSLAGKIRFLAGHPEEALRMGQEARAKAEKEFDIRIHGKTMQELYRQLIQR